MKIDVYQYADAKLNHSHSYLLPKVRDILRKIGPQRRKLFELGCGNGAVASELANAGWCVTGVDPSSEGIAYANEQYPSIDLHLGSADDPLATRYGRFPIVLSLEVVEHVYSPATYAATLFDLVEPGGHAILSTPFHGYWKNLALALTGKMDSHFTALWEGGHIKFWSEKTLSHLLERAGFCRAPTFYRVGRVNVLAKSMIAVAHRPL